MQEYKVGINKDTNETRLLLYYNGELIGTTLAQNEEIVRAYGYVGLVKPNWDGENWSESATEEEIGDYNNSVLALM